MRARTGSGLARCKLAGICADERDQLLRTNRHTTQTVQWRNHRSRRRRRVAQSDGQWSTSDDLELPVGTALWSPHLWTVLRKLVQGSVVRVHHARSDSILPRSNVSVTSATNTLHRSILRRIAAKIRHLAKNGPNNTATFATSVAHPLIAAAAFTPVHAALMIPAFGVGLAS